MVGVVVVGGVFEKYRLEIALMQAVANPAPDVCTRSGDGNCQRDVDPGYDGAACACVPCPNAKLCGRWMPPFFLWCNDGYCFGCAITWGGGVGLHVMYAS